MIFIQILLLVSLASFVVTIIVGGPLTQLIDNFSLDLLFFKLVEIELLFFGVSLVIIVVNQLVCK